jgi:GMP synthase - Glutamine amidotransferase domain
VHAARRPLVGICFGHQLVARALGGETRAADQGWGVGVHECRLVASPPWLPAGTEGFALLCSHKDQVTRLPEGAELLATSAFCPISAFTVGEHLLCFQGHPEFTAAYARELMDFRRELLGEAVHGAGIASLDRPVDSVRVGRWILAFVAFAGAAARAVA